MECAAKAVGGRNLAAIGVMMQLIMLLSVAVNAAVYKVGDAAGWTTIGNIDYKNWAATKTFRVSDVIGTTLHLILY